MKKSNLNLNKIEQLYSDNLEKFGIDSKSVGWSTPESQKLRFQKLMEVVDNRDEPFSLNELGCGYGELFKFCLDEGFLLEQYRGYDISQKMIEAAKDYINNDTASFVCAAEIDRKCDYTVTSGIFNVKFNEQSADWETYIKNTLEQMFEASVKGIAFNLLSKYVDYETENLYYADPCYYFDFCKTRLSRRVSLIHDYNLFEWTMIVRK